jgi:hypothetical protein
MFSIGVLSDNIQFSMFNFQRTGRKNKACAFFKKISTQLFVFGSVLGAFLYRYIYFVISLGVQHITTTQHKSDDTGYLQVEKKSRGGDPIMGKITILYLFQLLVIFLLIAHNAILCCKNRGSG